MSRPEGEFYSKGYHAEVYWVNPQEKLLFPGADLVRVNNPLRRRSLWVPGIIEGRKEYARLLFYKHKIAQTLFPGNFPDVVGARTEGEDEDRTDALFSRKANIPDEHSTFSAHIIVNDQREKVSACLCSSCVSHRAFHRSNALFERAIKTSTSMEMIGIRPDYVRDPSDYCLTKEENIIFFEVKINVAELERHLSSLKSLSFNEREALVLVKRYNELREKRQ